MLHVFALPGFVGLCGAALLVNEWLALSGLYPF